MNPAYEKRAVNILQRINELAAISEDEACITRLFGTPAFVQARNKVVEWMQQAGLQTRIDNMGNARGRLIADHPNAKTLVIASHIDSVINAGKFDGPLGVVMGLDIIEHVTDLPFHIELIAFSDEEGCRFHTTYLGSKVVAGSFDNNTLTKKDADGVPLQQIIESMGGDCGKLLADAIPADQWLGYFEIHIEQGPVLYEKDIPVALVTAIAAQSRVEMILKGEAGHAGTVPMHMRHDALCAAAELVLEVENFAKTYPKPIVATIGKLQVSNAASNVIPGEVICTLDLRSADPAILSGCYQDIEALATAICRKRNIQLQWNLVQKSNPVYCDEGMSQLLRQSIKDAGYPLIELVSGAGHDGVAIAEVAPVAMLFVRCFKGISHHPLENVALKDLAAAVEVSSNFIALLSKTYNQG